jgi:hypothetical protein
VVRRAVVDGQWAADRVSGLWPALLFGGNLESNKWDGRAVLDMRIGEFVRNL